MHQQSSASQHQPDFLSPPVAATRPKLLEIHGKVRRDDYYWLRDREDPEVIAYLEAENRYAQAAMAPAAGLRKEIYNEIVRRIDPCEASVPHRHGSAYYYDRFEEGSEYPLFCRRSGSLEAPEEVLLDQRVLAEGHDFCDVAGIFPSPSGELFAYTVDMVGRRLHGIRIVEAATGKVLDKCLTGCGEAVAWANDGRTFYYVRKHPQTLRYHQIWRHRVGSAPADDDLVFEELDETFNVGVYRSKSKRFVIIHSSQTVSSEAWLLDADDPGASPKIFMKRCRNHEYFLDHIGERFVVRTNFKAKNFRMMEVQEIARDPSRWAEVIPHREEVFLEAFTVFQNFLVVQERKNGLTGFLIHPWDGGEEHRLELHEPAYTVTFGANVEADSSSFRFRYTSLTTPRTIYDYDMNSRQKTLLKRRKIMGGFEPGDYRTERLWATARDGTKVPISIVYRRDFHKDGSCPLLLYGYGAYGVNIDPEFELSLISLLDRGFAYAIAHVRGGQELGRRWYEQGKLLEKINSFSDFIDCARHLIDGDYTAPDRLFADGRSAGGLLMGGVTNMAPQLFKGVHLGVPFVDVLTTMLDETLPLTTAEYDEWGDPRDSAFYQVMSRYSPYDNIESKDYPNVLVTAGLHDSQVQYWEPAKYVARLRTMKTDSNRLLLKTEMGAGHAGATGRYKYHESTAFIYTFFLELAGIKESS